MVSAAHFSFMGICRNTTFEVLYCNLFSGISRWYHYHKSEVNSMKAEKKEINIQIGKRLQTARENSGYTQEVFAETLDVGVEHYRKIEICRLIFHQSLYFQGIFAVKCQILMFCPCFCPYQPKQG